jgi:crotonobetainyl-CoA:carnitine CoA-transferase CaiB-like acyl-CoA transferase
MTSDLFSDLTVIDCASFIAGPAAATIMADFGARVIKIEPPGAGDSLRQVHKSPGFPPSAHDYFWLMDNRNKSSLALDLKHDDAKSVLETLVRQADVFITNFPSPIRDRLGLSPDDLMPLNNRLIYASLTPYGEVGPERDNTGYDATAWWARSGLMDAVRASPQTPPALSVPGMGDHPTAVALFGAIAAALYQRERTGKGAHVSTSLLANGLWSVGAWMQGVICGADFTNRPYRGTRGALTEFYCCKDGRWFLLACLNQTREWPILINAIGQPELGDDPRFATQDARRENIPALLTVLEQAFITKDWADWKQILSDAGITIGAASRPEDHLSCPQVNANGMLPVMDDAQGMRTIDSPIHIAGHTKHTPRRAPDIGEHSAEVLAGFGFSVDQIDRLVKNGAVALSNKAASP